MLSLPINSILLGLAPSIHLFRRFLEVANSSYQVFLLLGVWWTVVILAEPVFRYWLPILCAALLLLLSTQNASQPTLASETTLQTAVADLTAIEALLPSLPSFPPTITEPATLVRACAILYIPYLILTLYLIRLRVLVAIVGSVVLAWRAPWAVMLRNSLWRNAWIRWTVYHTSAILTGRPLPLAAQSAISTSTLNSTKSLRFLFTVYENQRWWLGLEFTAALLPAERPSWCSKSQQAVAPPNAFVLPEDTTIFLPDKDGKGRVKRRATWSWEENEWRVIVRREGSPSLTRVERALPSDKEENPGLLMKAAVKMRESNSQSSLTEEPEGEKPAVEDQEEEEDWVTDEDGWIYGDNKWEKLSAKGGMGKYTRFRRWTRVAVVTESIEPVADGEVEQRPTVSASPTTTTLTMSPPGSPIREESPLRQRLKNAMHKATI
ncbi:Peroxin/Ferlin domain-containing protein [Mycena indigotica]|uniref:Peroxin/Ferlin domain-containing protein n=1 Tax=Mycena indigotica TaxID=2126181 RepID=A0A8H6WK37_9AGAR|nr:Peroxin/Ferlin domain-containing protein [Mycena indigotica]KAF7315309.1 Peroxin/Ferlin domain-containing protein [Mycena indigotica]